MSAMIVLCTGLLFFLLLPEAKSLSLLILLFGIGAILIPFVLMSRPEHVGGDDPNGCDGRSISCCAGPKPVGTPGKHRTQPIHTSDTADPSDPVVIGSKHGPHADDPSRDE